MKIYPLKYSKKTKMNYLNEVYVKTILNKVKSIILTLVKGRYTKMMKIRLSNSNILGFRVDEKYDPDYRYEDCVVYCKAEEGMFSVEKDFNISEEDSEEDSDEDLVKIFTRLQYTFSWDCKRYKYPLKVELENLQKHLETEFELVDVEVDYDCDNGEQFVTFSFNLPSTRDVVVSPTEVMVYPKSSGVFPIPIPIDIDNLPPSLNSLTIYGRCIYTIQSLPVNLQILKLQDLPLKELILPQNLKSLSLHDVPQLSIEKLSLPPTLKMVDIYRHPTYTLPKLPEGLETLYVDNTKITEFENLPEGLVEFRCRGTDIQSLESLKSLPTSLKVLDLSYTEISDLKGIERFVNLTSLYISETGIPKDFTGVYPGDNNKKEYIASLRRILPKLTYLEFDWLEVDIDL